MTTRIKAGNLRRGIVRGAAVGALGLATCLGTIGVQVLAAAPSGAVTSTITVGLTASSIAVATAGPKAGYLYVTNAGSKTVSVIDPTTNAVVATISVGTRPTGVAVASTGPDAGDVYVTNYTSGTVSVIEPTTNTVIATIEVGKSPGGIAVAAAGPDAGDIYVADGTTHKVSVIDPATNAVVATIEVGTQPADVAVAAAGPDAGDIYVADAGSAKVSVIDPATNAVVTTIRVGTEPLGIAVASTATYAGDVYVTNGGNSSVSVIDPATNTVVATIGVGAVPSSVAVASTGPDAGDVYVTNLEGASVSVIAPAATPATDVVAGDIAVGGSPTNVPADAAYEPSGANSGDVYVTVEAFMGTSSVWRLGVPGAPPDVTGHVGAQQVRVSWTAATTNGGTAISGYTVTTTATGTHGCSTTGATTCTVTGLVNGHGYTFTVTATNVIGEGTPSTPVSARPVGAHIIAVGSDPSAIAVAGVGPDAGDVYVANTDSNTVSVIDPTNTSVDTINVGTQPSGIAVAPGGPDAGDVYVANRGSASVSVISPLTNLVFATITLGIDPNGIVVSTAGDIYVDGTTTALGQTGVLRAIAPVTHIVFAGIAVGTDPSGIAVAKAGPDAGDIFVANRGSNTVSVINLTNTSVDTIGVGTGPVGVAVNTLGTRVYVTDGGKETVSEIWTTDDTVKHTIGVGTDLAGIAISSSNGDIYAVHHATPGQVSVLSPSPSGGVTATIGVGASPVAVAYEPVGASAGDIYVTATGTSSVWRLGVPGAPPDVTGHVGAQQVRVSWTAATTNGGTAISGYTVETTATGAHGCSTTGATTCTVTGLMNGHGYTFTVTATNAMGAGTPSAPVSASPVGVPAAPTTIAVAKETHEIQISWVPPTTDGGSPVTEFTVHFTTGAVACTVGVATNQTFCDITGLVIGQKYTFYVTADNGNGTGTESTTVAATFSGVPGSLTLTGATRGPGSATIHWSAPATDGATTITGYTVETTVTGAHGCTTTGTATSCTVTGLVDGHSYTFEVYATNGIGTGPDSLGATVTPAGVPLAPTGVVVVRGTRSAFVGWGSAISQGTPITGYTVETAIVGSTLCSTTTTACTVTGLVNGQTYQIAVTATNHVGQGTASTPVEVTPAGKPVAPTNVTAVGHTSSATIEWTDSSTTNGTAITGYRAESSTGAYACTAGPTSTTCVVTGLVDGTSYVFQVRARNGVGTSATATSNSVTPSAPGAPTVPSGPQAGAPSAPTSVTGTASTRAAVISWSAPATNGAAITGYTVESSTGQHGCSTGGSPGGTTCVVTGLVDGTTYSFSVTATNEAGASAASNPVVVVPKGAPAAPTGVTAVGGAGSATISWLAATADGTAVTKYTVKTTATGKHGCTTAGGGISTTACTVAGLVDGHSYTFDVTATNGVGTSPASSAATAVPKGAPTAPRDVTAARGARSASISWKAPATDGGSAVTGYTAKTTESGTHECTAAAELGCKVAGLVDGRSYTFDVTATNEVGTSPASKLAVVVPEGVPGRPRTLRARTVDLKGGSSVVLTWRVPATTGGLGITGYRVFRAETADGPWKLLSSGGDTSYTDTHSAAGETTSTTYFYKVEAVNALGAGAPAAVSARIPVAVGAVGGGSVAVTPTGNGWWVVSSTGVVTAHGVAKSYGSLPGRGVHDRGVRVDDVVGIAADAAGTGYWLVTADGAVYGFGSAKVRGSEAGKPLAKAIVGIAGVPGRGNGGDDEGAYWLVAADGGVFSFGGAHFYGSAPGTGVHVDNVVGLTPTSTGTGYWLVTASGRVFAFGAARWKGSAAGEHSRSPVVGLATDSNTGGYWLVTQTGTVYSYGAPNFGGGRPGTVGVVVAPTANYYTLVGASGDGARFGS